MGREDTKDIAALLVFTANSVAFRSYDLESEDYSEMYRNSTSRPLLFDYLYDTRTFYWGDMYTGRIHSAVVDDEGKFEQTAVIARYMENTQGIAVDWVHHNLYVANAGQNAILVLTLDGMSKKTLVTGDMDEPRALVVDPRLGWMYWTDWGEEPKIEKCGMNGEVRKVIFTRDLGWPNGLTIDYQEQRLYFVDARQKLLASIDTEGGDFREILLGLGLGVTHGFSLDFFREQLFWSDWNSESIYTISSLEADSADSGSGPRALLSFINQPMGVRVFHPERQPWGENRCPEAKCSHFCLAVPDVAGIERGVVQCACPDIMALVTGSQCATIGENGMMVTNETFFVLNNETIFELNNETIFGFNNETIFEFNNETIFEFNNETIFEFHNETVFEFNNETIFEVNNQTIFEVNNQTIFEVNNETIFEFNNETIFEFANQTIFEVNNQTIFEFENQTIFEFENQTTFEDNNETTTLPEVGTPSPATSEQLSESLGRLEREVSAWSRIQGRQEVLLDQLNATLWREGQATRPWLEELNQTVHRQGGALKELEGALDTLDRTQRSLQNVIGLQEERLTEQENAIHSLEVSLQSQNQASLFYKRLMLFGKSRQYRIFPTPVRGLQVFSSRAGFNTLEEAKSSCVVVGGKLIEMTQAQLLEASSSLKRDGLVSAWHWIGWARQDGGHQWAFLSNQEPVGNVTWANPVPDSAKCARFLPHGLFSGEMCSSQYGDPALCTL